MVDTPAPKEEAGAEEAAAVNELVAPDLAEVQAAVEAEPVGETAEVDNLVEELASDVATKAAVAHEDAPHVETVEDEQMAP